MRAITNEFVRVAPDCPVTAAVVPAARGGRPTVAVVEYELLIARPYRLTREDLIFETHVRRSGMSTGEAAARGPEIRAELFARPRACMRASALPKRYGWGVHYDGGGRLALYAMESADYRRFAEGTVDGVKVVPAMRSRRAG